MYHSVVYLSVNCFLSGQVLFKSK